MPRRGICNQSWIRGERRPVPHSSRVGSQITGCSNLYPLNAPQRVSEIWLPVFTVSCFTVNIRAQIRDLTSKPRPNSEPAIFSFFGANWAPSARDSFYSLPSASTSRGDDEVYLFSLDEPSRDPWHTARPSASPVPRPLSLSRHATCHGGVSVTVLGYAGSAGLCPTTSGGWARRSPVALPLPA